MSQFGWGIWVLGVVSRHLILVHVVVVRRACGHRKGVNRSRLRTVWLRRLGRNLRPPALARRLMLGRRRNIPGGGRGWRGLLLWWWRWWLLAWDGRELWRISSGFALFLPVRTTQGLTRIGNIDVDLNSEEGVIAREERPLLRVKEV